MNKPGFYLATLKCKISGSHKYLIDYYRNAGIEIGEACLVCSNILGSEPFLIKIGNNVTISTGVTLLTHDYSAHLIFENKSDLYGRITIGDNCFIGANSTVLYGVSLGNNIIVAAGSVVTKSFSEENIIIAGNPARKIGTWDGYREKYRSNATPSGDQIKFSDLCDELRQGKYLVKK